MSRRSKIPDWPASGLDTLPAPTPNPTPVADEVMSTARDQRSRRGKKQPRSGSSLPGVGDRIGHYEIVRPLGQGGMGVVFLARDTRLARRVAIKFLKSSNRQLAERFLIEARATAQCRHDNIVVIYQVDEHDGMPFMVLEHLKGQTLTDLLAGEPLSPSRAIELMVPVLRALVCAHDLDIVHRDLKPDNIFVTDTGAIKVLDFGIAKVLEQARDDRAPQEPARARLDHHAHTPSDAAMSTAELIKAGMVSSTRTGALVGTLPYMSPEQWGHGEVDHRTDIWAVGIMLYEMLTGHHPLAPAKGQELIITSILDEPMPSARDADVAIPGELAVLIDRSLRKRKQERVASARDLLQALERLLPGQDRPAVAADQCPYLGLSAFQESDADRFYGRSDEITGMMSRLRSQPLVGVVGTSGVGKSSFVRAGVIPALKNSGEPWEAFVLRPGRHPLAALSSVLVPFITGDSTVLSEHLAQHDALTRRLAQEPGYLGTLLRNRARASKCKIVLFIDQFEELYTLVHDEAVRAAFTTCLAGVADDATSPLRVIVSLRSDFLDRVAEDRYFMSELSRSLLFLSPPGRDGLEEALRQPARMAGYRFESQSVIDDMINAIEATPGSLPLLQFAATQLWTARDHEQKLLTEASYQSIGGIAGALARHADQVAAAVSSLSSDAPALVQAIFQRLVTPDRTRAIASMSELCELTAQSEHDRIQTILDRLIAARLLVVSSDDDSDEAAVEIVHESLIHSWPRLGRWLDDNAEDAVFLEQLRNVARQWKSRERAPGLLWRGDTMLEARRWHQRYRGRLSAVQAEYLAATFALADRAARKKRIAIAGTMALLAALVVAAAVALVLIRNAERQATREAEEARRAKERIQQQMQVIENKEGERRDAEKRADDASAEVEMSKADLAEANEQLRQALEKARGAHARAMEEARRAEEEREKAEKAQKRASAERERAEQAADEARQATASEQRTNKQLQDLLKSERERADKLESKLGKVSKKLK